MKKSYNIVQVEDTKEKRKIKYKYKETVLYLHKIENRICRVVVITE